MEFRFIEHDVKSGKESILFSDSEFQKQLDNFSIYNYIWSPDEKYILFTGLLPARSVKSGGDFYVFDVEHKKLILKVESDLEQENIKFSPDSKKIGFVQRK